MTGSETYKEFDTNSIVTNADSQATVKIGKLRFRKRELFLAGVALFALILVLVLAIVLAVEVGKNNDDDNAVSGSAGGQSGQSQTHDNLCTTPGCLKAAHYEKSIMDEAFDPCQDFYSYACGHYDETNPQTYLLPDVTPFKKIQLDNVYKLLDILSFPVDRFTLHSYERKLKHLLDSCNNHFDKMDLRGQPLIEKVIKPWGSTFFLDEDFDATTFDLNVQLKKTHIDFWTAAFFTVNVVTDQLDWHKKIVELDYGGLGMSFWLYFDDDVSALAKSIYKEYITHVLSLVSVDATTTVNTTIVDIFAEDVLDIETDLAHIIYYSPELANPHQEDFRMSLDSLTSLSNNTIDFTDYMKTLFNHYPSLMDGQTTVAVRRAGYFEQLGYYLAAVEDTEEGKRKLSNYLIWTLINRYSHDLSWDYIHAKRKLNNYIYGQKDDSSGAYYCFTVAENTMMEAMDAVFIKHFVKQQDKMKAEDILGAVREEMMKGIESLPWMAQSDRQIASQKIRDSLYKIGYADFMVDDDLMDQMYYEVDIDPSDYFGNLLNLNKLYRNEYNQMMGSPTSRTIWAYHVFDPVVEYYNPWHELIATAAVFQDPLFGINGPAYANYGSVGSLMAKHLIHAVDEYGSSFRMDGKHFGNWYTQVTTDRYQEIRQCAIDVQRTKSLGTFVDPQSQVSVTPNISNYADYYAPEMLSDSSGLRLAYHAYKVWEGRNGREKMPPGFPQRNTDQMFFVAFAQASCQNTPDILKVMNLNRNIYPGKTKVNLAVSQVPEFAQVFNCRAGQPMYPSKTCTLF